MAQAAPNFLSSHTPVERPSCAQHGKGPTQMSWSKVIDPRSFRARFAGFWADFLHENYRNPEEVAVTFGVRYQTALNWWQGVNRPSGDVVALAGRPFQDFLEGRG